MKNFVLPIAIWSIWATVAAAQSKDIDTAAGLAAEFARAIAIPSCTIFVDADAAKGANGTAASPLRTIAEAVAFAEPGAIICVAEGVYPEKIEPGDKPFTLAGGFQSGSSFTVRDSARFVSRAQGDGGGSFLRIADVAPTGDMLTAIDGFEITGYERAIVREYWESQRLDITNNSIHDNICTDLSMVGAAFALDNVSGTISGNAIVNNSCGRGGGGFINDGLSQNAITIESNLIDGNAGAEPDGAHGGGLYLFASRLIIRGNVVVNNRVTQWGGGIYIGAYAPGGQMTTAELSWNVYRGNRAGDSGGGFFCDDGASCIATHEIYDRNCGGNVLVDGGAGGSGPTVGMFTNITNVGALSPDCKEPGIGFLMDTWEGLARDNYTISNAIFWGNGENQDLGANCGSGCNLLSFTVDHSMVQSKALEDGYRITFGPNLIAPTDPLFDGAEIGDFRLSAASPAIGSGVEGSDLGAFGGATAAEIERLIALARLAVERTANAGSEPLPVEP